MKHMKFFAAVTAAVMLASALPLTANAEEAADNVYENGELKIVFDDIELNQYENGWLNSILYCYEYSFESIKTHMSGTVFENGESRRFESVADLGDDYYISARSAVQSWEYGAEYLNLNAGENDLLFYFGEDGKGEETHITLNLVHNRQFITDFEVTEATYDRSTDEFRCDFTAVAHTEDGAETVSGTDSGYGITLQIDEDFRSLPAGEHTLHAHFLDADAAFALTVYSNQNPSDTDVTDFSLAAVYDAYLDRGCIKLVNIKSAQKTVEAYDATVQDGHIYLRDFSQRGVCVLDSDPWALGEHELTVTLGDVTKTGTYRVTESALDHVEAEDLFYYEGDSLGSKYDTENSPIVYLYDPECTLFYKDGTSVLSTYGRIQDLTACTPGFDKYLGSFTDDQTDKPWDVGIHTVRAVPFNRHGAALPELETTFEVTVEAIKSLSIADANADGSVDITDATHVQKSAAGLCRLTPKQEAAADLNGDGVVDVADATMIQHRIAFE